MDVAPRCYKRTGLDIYGVNNIFISVQPANFNQSWPDHPSYPSGLLCVQELDCDLRSLGPGGCQDVNVSVENNIMMSMSQNMETICIQRILKKKIYIFDKDTLLNNHTNNEHLLISNIVVQSIDVQVVKNNNKMKRYVEALKKNKKKPGCQCINLEIALHSSLIFTALLPLTTLQHEDDAADIEDEIYEDDADDVVTTINIVIR